MTTMNIDPKHDLLKASISNSRAQQKNVKTAIDHSMVATADQKTLGMDLQNESAEDTDFGKKKKAKKAKEALVTKDETSLNKEELKIERNPLKLLGLF
jgi:hypothetical protein